MKLASSFLPGLPALLALALLAPEIARAYPPAPDHIFYGVVRDENGDPIVDSKAQVILRTAAGTNLVIKITPGVEPGMNYKLRVPMDAGLTADVYRPTALKPQVPFKVQVRIGTTTYLPIEMTGDYAQLGLPGRRTRLDLTVGRDSVGDGLPDAWKRILIAQSGQQLTLQDIRPQDDFDGDGMSNLSEYYAGTYAWDPADALTLRVTDQRGEETRMAFLAITGRSYTVLGSDDMKAWTQVGFRVESPDREGAERQFYSATDVREMLVVVKTPAAESPKKFFKLALR